MAAKDSGDRPPRAGKPAASSRAGKSVPAESPPKKAARKAAPAAAADPGKPKPKPAAKAKAAAKKAEPLPKAEPAPKDPPARPEAKPAPKAPRKGAAAKPPEKAPPRSAAKTGGKAPEKGPKPAAKAPAPPAAPRKPAPVVIDDEYGDIGDGFEDEGEPSGADLEETEESSGRAAPEAAEAGEEVAGVGTEAEAGAEAEDGKPKKKAALPIPPMPPRRADGTITIAYSPDSDDAFMMYALESGKVDTEDRRYACVRADIQLLNDEAKSGTYDVTALSFGAYPVVNDRYALLPCGGSFGDNQGPILVAKTPIRASEVNGLTVAVPGMLTTATMVLRLWLPRANLRLLPLPFDQIGPAVKAGKARAGVLIHEGQLTWREEGLVRVTDFGQWWGEKTEGLPLPLGGNAIRRDILPEERAKIALDLKRSIAYALGHREEALEYALKFSRGLDKAKVDKYVSMYVNELTLDVGERGRQAVRLLLEEAHRAGVLPKLPEIEFA